MSLAGVEVGDVLVSTRWETLPLAHVVSYVSPSGRVVTCSDGYQFVVATGLQFGVENVYARYAKIQERSRVDP